jgi:endoglucanase
MRLPQTRRSRAVTAIAVACAIAIAGATVALARGGDRGVPAGTTPVGTAADASGGSGSVPVSTKPSVSRPSISQPVRSPSRLVRKPAGSSTVKPSAEPTKKATAKPTRKPSPKPQPVVPQQGNPLSQISGLYVDPQSEPVYWVTAHRSDSRQAAIKAGIADRPIARWFNGDGADASDARAYTAAAAKARKLPVLVFYNIPERGCGEGAASAAAYRSWIDSMAASIGKHPAVVILEPDALAGIDCLGPAAQTSRLALFSYAVDRLRSSAPNTWTYLDAGHDDWTPAGTMAKRLKAAGIAHARGFALNVSNFQSTSRNVSYAGAVNAALGSAKHFVIDTSRNGKPLNGDDWCNPTGQKVGVPPRTGGATGLDAQLWVKPPGESDGDCGIGAGTEAGDFSPAMAMKLLGH